jgi:aminoglycoside phosphotransferase (APT) family kinase protein
MSAEHAERLLCVLRATTGVPNLAYRTAPRKLTGGFWAELLAFSLEDPPPGWEGELVARVMPDPLVAAKETAIQSVVADAGVPTPRVRASGGPDDGLGRAFMVMDHADGVPLLAGLDDVGGLLGAPRRLWRMPDVLASVMAALHMVDPVPIRARLASVDGVATTVPEMLDNMRSSSVRIARSDLVDVAQWLIDNPCASAPDVVCHGDVHPFNVLNDVGGQVTLLDWSAAVLAPRAYDVAFTSFMLADAPIGVPRPMRGLVRAAGRRLAARFVRRYHHHSGTTVDPVAIEWHSAVVALRALVEVAGWAHDQVADARAGHPWLLSTDAFATQLHAVSGVTVRAH